jgi:hypothetical protein
MSLAKPPTDLCKEFEEVREKISRIVDEEKKNEGENR